MGSLTRLSVWQPLFESDTQDNDICRVAVIPEVLGKLSGYRGMSDQQVDADVPAQIGKFKVPHVRSRNGSGVSTWLV